jgi:DNA-binding winged helix-turn-helix (wHTH) protein
LDPGEQRLTRRDAPVTLTPKAYDLLTGLVRSHGRLISKGFLLQSVWPDVDVEENSLAKAVAEIRKCLGESPNDQRNIGTARHGYRFVAKVSASTT